MSVLLHYPAFVVIAVTEPATGIASKLKKLRDGRKISIPPDVAELVDACDAIHEPVRRRLERGSHCAHGGARTATAPLRADAGGTGGGRCPDRARAAAVRHPGRRVGAAQRRRAGLPAAGARSHLLAPAAAAVIGRAAPRSWVTTLDDGLSTGDMLLITKAVAGGGFSVRSSLIRRFYLIAMLEKPHVNMKYHPLGDSLIDRNASGRYIGSVHGCELQRSVLGSA